VAHLNAYISLNHHHGGLHLASSLNAACYLEGRGTTPGQQRGWQLQQPPHNAAPSRQETHSADQRSTATTTGSTTPHAAAPHAAVERNAVTLKTNTALTQTPGITAQCSTSKPHKPDPKPHQSIPATVAADQVICTGKHTQHQFFHRNCYMPSVLHLLQVAETNRLPPAGPALGPGRPTSSSNCCWSLPDSAAQSWPKVAPSAALNQASSWRRPTFRNNQGSSSWKRAEHSASIMPRMTNFLGDSRLHTLPASSGVPPACPAQDGTNGLAGWHGHPVPATQTSTIARQIAGPRLLCRVLGVDRDGAAAHMAPPLGLGGSRPGRGKLHCSG
jgi:hypothetical protein